MWRAGPAAQRKRADARGVIVLAAAGLALLVGGCGSGSSTSKSSVPGSKSSVPGDFFGVNPGLPPDATDFQDMATAGIQTLRTGFSWSTVQPEPGNTYSWRSTDATVAGLAAQGIQLLPVLAASPTWVAPEATTPPLRDPADGRAWTAFLKAAVDRYGPDGSFWRPAPGGGPSPFQALCHCDGEPTPITSWQVWNEPSLVHYFTPKPSVSGYARLLRISHDAIESQDPDAQIVLAGVPGFSKNGSLSAWQFLGRLFARPGVNSDFDVVALHPYSRNIRQLRFQIRKVRAVMSGTGHAATPLWVTELGWGSAPPDRYGLNKGVTGQKRLLTRAFQLLLRERSTWHLGRVYWFDWRDPPPTAAVACSFCGSAGLLRNDRQPKPAYHAFTHFAPGRSD